MRSFLKWLKEDAPTNVSAGTGIRGFGDVTGQPAGNISNYAAANAIDSAAISKSLSTNTVDGVIGYEGGDTEDMLMKKMGRSIRKTTRKSN